MAKPTQKEALVTFAESLQSGSWSDDLKELGRQLHADLTGEESSPDDEESTDSEVSPSE